MRKVSLVLISFIACLLIMGCDSFFKTTIVKDNIDRNFIANGVNFPLEEPVAVDNVVFQNNSVFDTNYPPETTPYMTYISFVGNAADYEEKIHTWLTTGGNNRKNGYVTKKSYTTANEKSTVVSLHDFVSAISADKLPLESHALILNFGQKEASGGAFAASSFVNEYCALVAYIRRMQSATVEKNRGGKPTKIVLVGLNTTDIKKPNGKSVNQAIKTAAVQAGVTFVDIAEIATKAEAEKIAKDARFATRQTTNLTHDCSSASCVAKNDFVGRKVAEEVFLSFYLDVEKIATPNTGIATQQNLDKWNNNDGTLSQLPSVVDDKPNFIFTGDSITDFFDGSSYTDKVGGDMKNFWTENIGCSEDKVTPTQADGQKYYTMNFGYSGFFVQSLYYHWKQGGSYRQYAEKYRNKIKGVVVMIGTNNLGPNGITSANPQERALSATETFEGAQQLIDLLKETFPNAKILLMSTFPRGTNGNNNNSYYDFTRLQVLAYNRFLYSKYGNGADARVRYVDIYEDFLKECGCSYAEYFCVSASDYVHPCSVAYKEIWWPTVKPIFDELLAAGN